MATTASLTFVQKLYIAYYGRPADPLGQNYWATQLDTAGYGTSSSNATAVNNVINSFGNSAEATAIYGSQGQAAQINNVYQNILNRAADTAGLNYYSNQIATGALTLAGLANAVLAGATTGTDAQAVANKLTEANSFTTAVAASTANTVGYSGTSAAASAKTWLAGVTSDSATVTTAENSKTTTISNINTASTSTTTAGQTFSLTSAVDTLTGTAGNDTFIGDNSGATKTVSAADSITGNGGTDTFKYYAATADTTITLPAMSGIANLYINGGAAVVADVSATGATAITLDNIGAATGTKTVAYSVAGSTQSVTLQNDTQTTGADTVQLKYKSTDTTANVAVNNFGSATLAQNLDVNAGASVATLALTSTGTNSFAVLDTATGLTAITDTGAGSLTLSSAVAGLKSFNASAATGAQTVTLTGAVNAAFAFTGGSANDVLDISAAGAGITTGTLLNGLTINGGAGTNTVILNNGAATTTTAITSLTSVQIIGDALANGTVNMSNFSGATGFKLQGAQAGAVTVNNLASTATLDYGTETPGANTIAVNAIGTGTSDTLGVTLGSSTAALGGAGTGNATFTGYETINLTSQGAANTITSTATFTATATAGGSETVNITDTTSLTLGTVTLNGTSTALNIAGATGTTFTSAAITAGTVKVTGGAVTETGSSNVLSFDSTGTTAAVTFDDTSASAAANLKGGSGNTTFVGGASADIISVGSGTNSINGKAGGDIITIAHGSLTNVDTLLYSATGQTGTGISANGAVSGLDVITGVAKGDKIDVSAFAPTLISVTKETAFSGSEVAGTVANFWQVQGTYNSTAGTFTASASGSDTLIEWDNNGTTAAGAMEAIVLVGYSGAAASAAAGVITLA